MTAKKVIIFDPVCGLSIGHNLPTIDKYANWINNEFGYVSEAWVATSKTQTREYLNFKKIPWVYGYWLHDNPKDELKSRKKGLKNDSILDILKNSVHHIWAFKNIEKSLAKTLHECPSYVFFPGADFYSLLSIWSMAKRRLVPRETILIIRLMGVMEWATKIPRAREIINQVIFEIKKMLGEQVRFTAETEKYAFELGCILNSNVLVTSIPSPITHKQHAEKSDRGFFNIACLGGARPDKGYFDILQLSHKTQEAFGPTNKKKIIFSVQSMNSQNLDYNWNYQAEIARSENIQLLKPRLSDEELSHEIQRADVVLLPYSQGTYASRGSAILFDTLPYGKPILGVGGTGFGDTIKHAGIGLTYNGLDDYVNRLSELINYTPGKLRAIKNNQEEYFNYMIKNLRGCFDD